jgi:hypothetical protein
MYELGGDVKTLIGLAIALAGLAGYYTGKFTGYTEGQRSVLAFMEHQQDRAEAVAEREHDRIETAKAREYGRQARPEPEVAHVAGG